VRDNDGSGAQPLGSIDIDVSMRLRAERVYALPRTVAGVSSPRPEAGGAAVIAYALRASHCQASSLPDGSGLEVQVACAMRERTEEMDSPFFRRLAMVWPSTRRRTSCGVSPCR
jgi:hypothetical protein